MSHNCNYVLDDLLFSPRLTTAAPLATRSAQPCKQCVAVIDGNPWFVAADVCRALGLDIEKRGAGAYLTALNADERDTVRISVGIRGNPNLSIISESGLYKFVLRAQRKNEAARKFQDWVTGTVLPAIRKNGGYVDGQEKLATGEMSEPAPAATARRSSLPPD